MCGRQLLSFRYLGRHFELEFVCRKITGLISHHASLTALMDFMSGDSFYLLIVPGRAVSILNYSRNGLLILEESAVSGAAG
jgi:hypothetical protein